MTIKDIGYDKLIGLENELKQFIDTSFKFYDLRDLHIILNSQSIHQITQKIKESRLVEVSHFPNAFHTLELVKEFTKRYNLKKKSYFVSRSICSHLNQQSTNVVYI